MFPARASLVIAIAASSLLGSCVNPTWKEGKITYGVAPTTEGPKALTLNVEVPAGAGPFPAILMVHGGGWSSGDLSTYDGFAQRAAAAGFVAVNINYRLARLDGNGNPGAVWPAQGEDVRCAMSWLGANAASLKADPSRVGIMGESAGGHLAMMGGYAQLEPRFDGAFCTNKGTVQIKAVGSLFGASDLIVSYETGDWYIKPTIVNFLGLPDGASPQDHPDPFQNANPTYWVGIGPKLPTYIIQGSADTLVTPTVQETFASAARGAGVDVKLEWVAGQGHGLGGGATFDSACDRLLAWFKETI